MRESREEIEDYVDIIEEDLADLEDYVYENDDIDFELYDDDFDFDDLEIYDEDEEEAEEE